jgi:hypothetical protein
MHGYTNYEQSKTLFEHGYRHPKPIRFESTMGGRSSDQNFGFFSPEQYPAFSLADIITMIDFMPEVKDPDIPEIIRLLTNALIKSDLEQIEQSNQRLKEAYEQS